jgi:signal transduction histidine kinase
MALHTQTIIFMICMAYLVMHGVIWLALAEHRSTQVRLWCVSGIISGISVVLLSMRGVVSEFMFIYVGQLLMVVGNAGRVIALRMYLQRPLKAALIFYLISSIAYYVWFSWAYMLNAGDSYLLLLFFGFYAAICIDYFIVGYTLNKKTKSLGPRLLMTAGLTFSSTLGFKTLWAALGLGAQGPYDPGLDQFVMMTGQFIAISFSNIGFLRICLERIENKKLQTERSLAVSEERSSLLARHKDELEDLLVEREEIIRQLTLSNKSAGMGALVASLAHELNQPLCAIQLNAQLVERKLSEPEIDVDVAKKFIDSVLADNRRAANIITKLRSLFEQQEKKHAIVDFDELVRDTLSLITPKSQTENIFIQCNLQSQAMLQGDRTQLQQVVLNLFNNAVDSFSESSQLKKSITVTSKEINQHILLVVEDNGSGIPDSIRNSVFELFKTTKAQGMGVGLWLSKTVVNAHRGDISFVTNVNQGTKFEVRLPMH